MSTIKCLLEDLTDAVLNNKYYDIPYILGSNKDEMRYLFDATGGQTKPLGKNAGSSGLLGAGTGMCGDREIGMSERFYKATRDWAKIQDKQGR